MELVNSRLASGYPVSRSLLHYADAYSLDLLNSQLAGLHHAGLILPCGPETKDFLMSKWPNRGESALLDCLQFEGGKAQDGSEAS